MPNIIIYTTPTCVYCKRAKAFFEKHDVPYEEKDVAADAEARKEMIQKSNQMGTPIIDFDGTIVIGFNKEELSQLINILL